MTEIVFLADQPQHLTIIAGWVYDEWLRHRPGETPATAEALFRGMLRRDELPLTLLALEGGAPIGTASIYLQDMDSRPALGPWMAAVYVAPGHRRRGVASALVRAIEAHARRLGVPRLYLYTPDQQRLYEGLGWRALEQTFYDGHDVTVMSTTLD